MPGSALVLELAVDDLVCQLIRPVLSIGIVPSLPHTPDHLLGNAGIPHMVEVVVGVVEQDLYTISTACHILIVQRLMDISDEVDDELGGLAAPPRWERGIKGLQSIVLQGADDATLLFAVSLEVNIAVSGRVIVRVDEVEGTSEPSPFRVADRIGPGRYAGEVMFCVVSEEILKVRGRLVRHKIGCDVRDCDMSEAYGRL